MKKLLIVLAFPCLVSASVIKTSQSDCTDLDMRNEALGTSRDQQEVAWCYAFTAADMLGYTFDLPEKASAADVAIAYNATGAGKLVRWLDVNVINRKDDERRQMAHTTGFNKVALDKALHNGWCPESVLPSEAWVKRTRIQGGWVEQSMPLKEAMIEINSLHAKRTTLSAQTLPFYYAFKNVSTPQDFLTLLKTKRMADFYNNLRTAVCRDDRRPFDYRWKVKMVIKNPRIFKTVNDQLNSGRIVGLDYDSKVLKDSSYRRMTIGSLHTSPIVGRRWNGQTNSCQYLIRDSYGKTCDGRYDSSYQCENGHVWLNESIIYPTMTSVVYMLSPRN
jgi:hypothetical protein